MAIEPCTPPPPTILNITFPAPPVNFSLSLFSNHYFWWTITFLNWASMLQTHPSYYSNLHRLSVGMTGVLGNVCSNEMRSPSSLTYGVEPFGCTVASRCCFSEYVVHWNRTQSQWLWTLKIPSFKKSRHCVQVHLPNLLPVICCVISTTCSRCSCSVVDMVQAWWD